MTPVKPIPLVPAHGVVFVETRTERRLTVALYVDCSRRKLGVRTVDAQVRMLTHRAVVVVFEGADVTITLETGRPVRSKGVTDAPRIALDVPTCDALERLAVERGHLAFVVKP